VVHFASAIYKAGRAEGKREIAALPSNVLRPQEIVPIGTPLPLLHAGIANSDGRAPSGTVKPQIKDLIENTSNRITTSEIFEKQGLRRILCAEPYRLLRPKASQNGKENFGFCRKGKAR
jgi:hypothetical protein